MSSSNSMMKSEMSNDVLRQESRSTGTGTRRPTETNKHRKRKRRNEVVSKEDIDDKVIISGGGSSGDDKEEVDKKIMALQQIVPGGESADNVDNLFETTAAYILDLQNQVKTMKLLASVFELLQKQKTKLGG